MQDLVFALRLLRRQPNLSVAAVLTLGLGLGKSLAVFTLVNAVLLKPLPYPDPDRLMTMGRNFGPQLGHASHRDVRFLRDHVRTCAPIAATVAGSGLNVSLEGRVSHQEDRLVSRGYFETLGIAPTWGRAFTPDEDADTPPAVVILNEGFVRREGLDPAVVVGRSMDLGGRAHTIVGVLGERHTRPSDPDIYRPLGADRRGGGQNLEVICRLTDASTFAALDTELAGLTPAARDARLASDRWPRAYSATPRHEWEFGSLRPALLTLMSAVALVLLVAAANTTGLLLLRAAGRRREIAVRTALGAAPRRIAQTLVIEGLVLAAIAGVVGLVTAPLLVRGLLSVAPAFYGQLATFSIDSTVLATALGLCALVGLAVSVPPLLEVLRVNLRDTLQAEGRSGTASRRSQWMRQMLIGAETAVCAVLLVGALLLLRTFINLVNVPTGFDATGVVTARMSVQGPQYDEVDRLIRFFETGVARLRELPGIEEAAVGASLPAERALNMPATLPDSNQPELTRAVNWRYVTPGYFLLLKIRYLTGRAINDADRVGAAPIAVVNETFAREHYGGIQQALGRRIAVAKEPAREIVGVVADTAGWALGDPPRAMMFVPLAQVEPSIARLAHSFFPPRWIVRSSLDTAGARRHLESVIRELDPTQPFIDVRSLESLMLGSIAMQRFYLVVLTTFAAFAVLLAAVGVYAAYSYAVSSRTAEIGVRLALGAKPGQILWSVVSRAWMLGAIATTIGLAAAAAASRLLRSVLFGISASDPSTYVIVGAALVLTVLMAALLPAIRAARVDPLAAIRR
jgi:predicted permease